MITSPEPPQQKKKRGRPPGPVTRERAMQAIRLLQRSDLTPEEISSLLLPQAPPRTPEDLLRFRPWWKANPVPGLASICAVDRDYVLVIERALKAAGITPTFTPDVDRSTHYIVQVAQEDVDRASTALKEYGAFVPLEEKAHAE
jgi:hypothetical protein